MQKTDAQDIRLVRAGTSRRLGTGRDRLISIILPIKNRARNAKALLSRLHAQRYEGSIEIIAVDSGSTDDTIPVLSEAGATVLTVPPSQFDYGLTRNAAARHARGDVFVFITSTMLPADDAWLRHLLDAYDSDETLAGVYSRSIPRPDADILNYRDYLLADLRTNRQEASTIRDGLYVRAIEDRDAHAGLSPSRLRHLISFSNVSAAIRPAVFRGIPFRAVSTCGEDMLWAREVLEAGYKVGHATSSIVLYSHKYSWTELVRRSFDDSAGSAAFAGTGFETAAVVPSILGIIRNDWNYLIHGCQLRGAELDHWKVQSVVRRSAQVVAHWVGSRRGSRGVDIRELLDEVAGLPGGSQPVEAEWTRIVTYPDAVGTDPGTLPYGRLAALAFASWGSTAASASQFVRDVEAQIVDDWSRLEQHAPAAKDGAFEAQLDLAVRRFACSAGSWIGAMGAEASRLDSARLSLLEAIKGGERITEMEAPTPLDTPVEPGWSADSEAFRRVIRAHEAEILAAARELDARADVMGRMHSDVTDRDRTIRDLQRELHEKVAVRDAMIRSLQAEMARGLAERDDVIRELQLALQDGRRTEDR